MRILFVIEWLSVPGGAERQLVTLACALASRGHECEVAAVNPESNLEPELTDAGIPFHRLGPAERGGIPLLIIRLVALIRQIKPDVVHAHLRTACMLSALSWPLTPSVRRVAVLHNPDYDLYPPRRLAQRLARNCHVICLRRLTDGVVAVSSSVACSYQSVIGTTHIDVIPNSVGGEVDVEGALAARMATRRLVGLSENDFVISFAARMVFQKGHTTFIKALKHLRESGHQPRTLLIGSGPLESAIRDQLAVEGLAQQVILVGDVPHAAAIRYIGASDLFVAASTYEGFGISAAEAMLLGVPVVATRIGGLTDVVGKSRAGILVAPNDPLELGSAIAHIMGDNAKRTELAANGPTWVRSEFAPGKVAIRWERYLAGIINAGC